jgi:pyruvate dehydrogenase E2 component (dihydrolipoamide acetyltransferase)
MASLLRMPAVAANATEAVLQDWSVAERAGFTVDDAIATVETEKAVVDIGAETDGVLLKRLVQPGAQVEVGAPIAVLGDPGEQVDDLEALLTELGVGDGTPAPSPTSTPTVPTPRAAAPEPATTTNGEQRDRIFASPLARRLAEEAGLSLREIRGSGPHGRILRRDIEAEVAERAHSAPAEPAGSAPYTEVPQSRLRKAAAARLTESKQTIPHFYVRATIDARRLLKLRKELNDGDVKVSVNDLVVKAVARAHTLVPEMNVTWAQDTVRQYSSVDVSLAVATDQGLLTPVLRGVDGLSISAVAGGAKELADRSRAGRLRQDDLEGGTISVTNLGMFGTEEFAAIINPPQAAILAVGAIREEPVARKGKLRVGPVMRLTLSVDHRPVDGVVAARWLRELVALLERPVRILA